MVKTVKGIYEHGEIRLLEDPHISGTQEVYIRANGEAKFWLEPTIIRIASRS